jgi:hypothetical protein
VGKLFGLAFLFPRLSFLICKWRKSSDSRGYSRYDVQQWHTCQAGAGSEAGFNGLEVHISEGEVGKLDWGTEVSGGDPKGP